MLLSVLLSLGTSAYAKEVIPIGCNSSERVIFQCQIGAKRALLCKSRDARNGYRYKYGSAKKIELRLPTATGASISYFRLASHPTPGGSVSYIHFSNQGYDYYLIDDSSKNLDGSFSPVSKLVVVKGENIVKQSICENDDAGISQDAYIGLPREAYVLPPLEPYKTDSQSPR